MVSGVGGQYNFVAQSFALAGARSIIMLPATRTIAGRVSSNIRWNYGHTTIPRHLRDLVVTEYGIADLRGKTDRDVIAAMLAVADSRFQDDLLARAKQAGKIERGFELPAASRDNTPQRIEHALAPARGQGLLPRISLRHRFHRDRAAAAERVRAPAGVLAAAPCEAACARDFFPPRQHPRCKECLARMGFERRSGLKDYLYAALLQGALESKSS